MAGCGLFLFPNTGEVESFSLDVLSSGPQFPTMLSFPLTSRCSFDLEDRVCLSGSGLERRC